jgi:hypothetical protein
MMNRIRMIMAAASAFAIAAPLAAQPASEVATGALQLQARLDAAVQSGSLTRREASQFREGVRQLGLLERDYARGGYNERETSVLRQRAGSLNRDITILEGSGGG